MAELTYNDNPVFGLQSGANTCTSGYAASNNDMQAGVLVTHDNDGNLIKFAVTSATCELSETPTSGTLHVYTDSGKETELTVTTDYTISGKVITVLRRDLFEVYVEYTGASAAKTETLELTFATNGDCQGVLFRDHVGDGADVAYVIGGWVKRANIVDLQPVVEPYIPGAIHLMD